MFSVRIDKTPLGYTFSVETMPDGVEMVALDSTPGVIAFVRADDPGAATALAWNRASHMHDFEPPRIEESTRLLGDCGCWEPIAFERGGRQLRVRLQFRGGFGLLAAHRRDNR